MDQDVTDAPTVIALIKIFKVLNDSLFVMCDRVSGERLLIYLFKSHLMIDHRFIDQLSVWLWVVKTRSVWSEWGAFRELRRFVGMDMTWAVNVYWKQKLSNHQRWSNYWSLITNPEARLSTDSLNLNRDG